MNSILVDSSAVIVTSVTHYPQHSDTDIVHSVASSPSTTSMKLTKRLRSGYTALSDEDEAISPVSFSSLTLSGKAGNQGLPDQYLESLNQCSYNEKAGTKTLPSHQRKLLNKYKWTECPDEATKDLEAIFDSAPDSLQILIKSYPNGLIALDARNPISWASVSALASDLPPEVLGKAFEASSEGADLLQQWLKALEQHHRINKIKVEMEKERKRVGWMKWKYWVWQDKRRGTRRAWERLGERVAVRMEQEGMRAKL